jgi:hypothetical protein
MWEDDDEKVEMEDFRRQTEAVESRCLLIQVCVRDRYQAGGGSILHTFPLLMPLGKNWLNE